MAGIGELSPARALAQVANARESASPILEAEFSTRRDRAQRAMRELRVDAVLLTAGANLQYFTGARWSMLERLTGALLPRDGEPLFIVPAFEEPRLRMSVGAGADFRVWQEDESPYQLCARVLSSLGLATGRIGADPLTPHFVVDRLAKAAGQIDVISAATISESCRLVKSPAEIALLRQVMQLTLEVQRLAAASLEVGVATADIVDFLNRAHLAAGSDSGSTFAIVAFGESTAYPHGPTSPQRLAEGDMVLVDTGCTLHGYHADLTRTYVFGEPTARQREIWEIERDAQQAAFDAIEVGGPCRAPDDAARRLLESKGFGPDYQVPGLPHRTGHGIGLEIHEPPYLVRGNDLPLAPGMCASIEPMLCLYGELGVRLEDHFYVADDGPRWFTLPATDLDAPFAESPD